VGEVEQEARVALPEHGLDDGQDSSKRRGGGDDADSSKRWGGGDDADSSKRRGGGDDAAVEMTVPVKLGPGAGGQMCRTPRIVVAKAAFAGADRAASVAAGEMATLARQGSRGWILLSRWQPDDRSRHNLVWFPASYAATFEGVCFAYPQAAAAPASLQERFHPVLVPRDSPPARFAAAVLLSQAGPSSSHAAPPPTRPPPQVEIECGPFETLLSPVANGQGECALLATVCPEGGARDARQDADVTNRRRAEPGNHDAGAARAAPLCARRPLLGEDLAGSNRGSSSGGRGRPPRAVSWLRLGRGGRRATHRARGMRGVRASGDGLAAAYAL